MENARLYRELQGLNADLEQRVAERTFELSEAYSDLRKEVEERTRAEETTRALLRISNKLNSTLDIEASLEILIVEAIRVMGASAGFAGLRVPEGMRMYKYIANGESIPFSHTWPPGRGMPGWVLEHGAPYLTNDAQNDPVMVHELPFNQAVRCALCTPILGAQGQVIGFFEVRDRTDGRPFTSADIEFLTALSPIASIAVENAQAYQKVADAEGAVQESYAQLRALAARLQSIREEERTDIARELRQLRPGMLDDLGLGPSIEWYAQEFQARTQINVETEIPAEDLDLSLAQATVLFRIFQETLTNVARHANASRVEATLAQANGELVLTVSDNGKGFDLQQVRGKRSLGLLGMRERAEMVQGHLEIQGEPGKGTTIMVRVPLGKAEPAIEDGAR
jgi:signal transduction histidine kinase